jgi:hypothetical protein
MEGGGGAGGASDGDEFEGARALYHAHDRGDKWCRKERRARGQIFSHPGRGDIHSVVGVRCLCPWNVNEIPYSGYSTHNPLTNGANGPEDDSERPSS